MSQHFHNDSKNEILMSFDIRLSSDPFKYSHEVLCSLLDHHPMTSIVYEDDNDCNPCVCSPELADKSNLESQH